jgi:NAD(P)-dependent dehydrogenase (short-subunit alcohol dehydrogenase family)
MNLRDQVAVVTGGGGGIGEGICLCLAREGAHVVVSDIKEELAVEVSGRVKKGGRKSLAVKTDVRDEAECKGLVETTLKEMGRLDVLVCAAGVSAVGLMTSPEEPMAVENIPVDAWDLTIDINLKGVFFATGQQFRISRSKKKERSSIYHLMPGARGRLPYLSTVLPRRG